jgi:DNA-directed RNA polymerase omega subunit
MVLDTQTLKRSGSKWNPYNSFSTTQGDFMSYISRGITIDTEKCVDMVGGNRFNLVIIAAMRAREIAEQNRHSSHHAHWHTPVTALLEVQNGELNYTDLKRLR